MARIAVQFFCKLKMYKTIRSTTLRENLADVLKAIEKKEDFLVVTKKGRDVATIVNLSFFEDLLALSSPRYLKSIKKSREDYKKGRFYTHEEVFGEL